MIDMFDKDDTGTIELNEFFGLWQYVSDWQKCFVNFDVNRNNFIELNELQTALRTFGYNLTLPSIQSIVRKFLKHDVKSPNQTQASQVNFETFLKTCITVKMLTDSFKQFDGDLDGQVTLSYEQYLQLITSNMH
ncbi:EF-hand [Basidiobolus meristosporus CBS 931.73]|uniref:EF-hand n=1 Tax=Basidiobolus meristosporus CBS 931.73 TaxID=1314790 RepID=A0A1Y1XUN6_9FUNG|nr:EF-hand [Basidiobolus meristosporus CBS 931.73]|eukprot:ORX89487.1 EF-hand [Basidiobolus meristosporus CBS 931.73]